MADNQIDLTTLDFNSDSAGFKVAYLPVNPATEPAECELPALAPADLILVPQSLTSLDAACKFTFPTVVPIPPVFIPPVTLPTIACTEGSSFTSNINISGIGGTTAYGSITMTGGPCDFALVGDIQIQSVAPSCMAESVNLNWPVIGGGQSADIAGTIDVCTGQADLTGTIDICGSIQLQTSTSFTLGDQPQTLTGSVTTPSCNQLIIQSFNIFSGWSGLQISCCNNGASENIFIWQNANTGNPWGGAQQTGGSSEDNPGGGNQTA